MPIASEATAIVRESGTPAQPAEGERDVAGELVHGRFDGGPDPTVSRVADFLFRTGVQNRCSEQVFRTGVQNRCSEQPFRISVQNT
jgi:hypothetical protein